MCVCVCVSECVCVWLAVNGVCVVCVWLAVNVWQSEASSAQNK